LMSTPAPRKRQCAGADHRFPVPKKRRRAMPSLQAKPHPAKPVQTRSPRRKRPKEAAVHTDAAVPAVHKTAAQPIPDPKSVLAHKAKKTEEKKEAAVPPADNSTDSASTDSASKPVETGSLSETATKPAKHKSQKPADGSAAVAPIKEKSNDAGYPSPLPPSDGATDGPAQ
jgi:hypothetical protein